MFPLYFDVLWGLESIQDRRYAYENETGQLVGISPGPYNDWCNFILHFQWDSGNELVTYAKDCKVRLFCDNDSAVGEPSEAEHKESSLYSEEG